jgi:hypothetical protein
MFFPSQQKLACSRYSPCAVARHVMSTSCSHGSQQPTVLQRRHAWTRQETPPQSAQPVSIAPARPQPSPLIRAEPTWSESGGISTVKSLAAVSQKLCTAKHTPHDAGPSPYPFPRSFRPYGTSRASKRWLIQRLPHGLYIARTSSAVAACLSGSRSPKPASDGNRWATTVMVRFVGLRTANLRTCCVANRLGCKCVPRLFLWY